MKALQMDYEDKIHTFQVKLIFLLIDCSLILLVFRRNYPMKKVELRFCKDMMRKIIKKSKDYKKNRRNMKMKQLKNNVRLKHYSEKAMIK
jgi:hypothetical protein